MILSKKPQQIQAIQFNGGLKNAIEVIKWLWEQNDRLTATYMPAIEGVRHSEEYVLVTLDSQVRPSTWLMTKGRWIVLDPESGIYLSSTENLMAGYDPVED